MEEVIFLLVLVGFSGFFWGGGFVVCLVFVWLGFLCGFSFLFGWWVFLLVFVVCFFFFFFNLISGVWSWIRAATTQKFPLNDEQDCIHFFAC